MLAGATGGPRRWLPQPPHVQVLFGGDSVVHEHGVNRSAPSVGCSLVHAAHLAGLQALDRVSVSGLCVLMVQLPGRSGTSSLLAGQMTRLGCCRYLDDLWYMGTDRSFPSWQLSPADNDSSARQAHETFDEPGSLQKGVHLLAQTTAGMLRLLAMSCAAADGQPQPALAMFHVSCQSPCSCWALAPWLGHAAPEQQRAGLQAPTQRRGERMPGQSWTWATRPPWSSLVARRGPSASACTSGPLRCTVHSHLSPSFPGTSSCPACCTAACLCRARPEGLH